MEENKDKNAERLAEIEKLRAELKEKMEAQRALENERLEKERFKQEAKFAQEAKEKQEPEVAQESDSAQTAKKVLESESAKGSVEVQDAKRVQESVEEKTAKSVQESEEVQDAEAVQEEVYESENEQESEETQEIEQQDAQENAPEEEKKKIKKRIFNIVYDVLIVVGVCLLLYGGYTLYQDYASSKESKESYDNLKDQFVVSGDDVTPSTQGGTEGMENNEPPRPKEWYEQVWVDLEGLQTQVNEDIVGWIYFENEDISYPILYSPDNEEYDRVRYDLVYAMCGSITLEAANSWDFSDMRNIIYGHNMRDLSMFGKLKYYKDEGYYQDHQYFQLMYDGMVYRYQIFSYFEVDETEVSYVGVNFSSTEDYQEMIEKLVSRAIHETGVEVTAEDKTVTLLTCSDDKTKRLLVNAVLVDEHVMANADGTYPDTEIDTEPGTDTGTEEPGTDIGTDDPGTEPDTNEPNTEPDDRFEQEYTYTAVNKTMWATTGVKIRNQPSADSVRMGYLAKGQAVEVLAICNENGWYRVQLRKGVGYVNGKYLTDVDPHVHTEIPGATAEAHTKCETCGAIISAEHVYVDEVITPATTTTVGQMKHTCACGYTYNREIPMITDTPSDTPEDPSDTPEDPGTSESPSESESTGTDTPSESEDPSEEPSEPESGSESTEPTEPSETETESESAELTEPSESETGSESTEPTESQESEASETPEITE